MKIVRKIQMWLRYGKISDTLHDDLTMFILQSASLNHHKSKNLSEMISGS